MTDNLNKQNKWKRYLPDVIAVIAFILISFAYFYPAVMEGREITQHDSLAAIGQGQEQRDYMARHDGERSRWNLSMFGGMPTYQMSPTYNSSAPIDFAEKVYSLFLPNYVYMVFIMLIGFYILMRAFRASPLLSALGAIAWTFSSYYFIIIAAGHIWKFITLAYIPPTIAGLVLIYRQKYLWGAWLFMVFTAFQIAANHIQMSYYFLFLMGFMVVAFGIEAFRRGTAKQFMTSTAVVIVAGLIGVLANISTLYHTWEYSKETMRGKSELSHHGAENKSESGLERDYITAWSYGVGETWTLLVPNTKGGASVPLANNETAMAKAKPEYRELYSQIGQYWGEQPGTSGPVYVGAFVLTLFVLGLFIVKEPIKWALLAGTIFSILLSWGKNFMPLTDFFIDYVPMYNKFRTVASILVVAEFCIPLLAMLALKELIERPTNKKEMLKYVGISAGITGGFALLFALVPTLFFTSFISSSEMAGLQSLPSEHIQPIMQNLTEMRKAMFTADAWRSVVVIACGTLFAYLMISQKMKYQWAIGGMLVVCLIDMWGVNKRYLNDDNFTLPTNRQQIFTPSPADQYVMEDKSYKRVLNMATSTFNDGVTPYWHKTIGGYHAAKLRRYQDLIDVHLTKEIPALQEAIINTQGTLDSVNADTFKVLNMLNTKWVMMPGQEGIIPIENPYAMGNAWFVDELQFVDNADDEIDRLQSLDLHRQAVADSQYKAALDGFMPTPADSASTIAIESYDSDRITYRVDAKKDEFAVFSEVYYPKGWQIEIDGTPAQMIRTNYTLRGMKIPAGVHTVEFTFDPTSIKRTDTMAYIALLLMLLPIGLIIYRTTKKQKTTV